MSHVCAKTAYTAKNILSEKTTGTPPDHADATIARHVGNHEIPEEA